MYEALLRACDNYQVMQQAHLHCLATEVQPDIARLVFERECLFAELQNYLTAVVYQVQKAVPESARVPILQARLTTLLEDDAVLVERLHAYRVILEQRRTQIQQGQRSLAATAARRPHERPWLLTGLANRPPSALCLPLLPL